jgi:hypothetical protein
VTFTSDQGVIGYETLAPPGGDFAAIPILPTPGSATTAPPAAAPAISVQASLAFGSVTVGQTKTLQLAIGNTGNAALSVTGFSGLSAPFSLSAALPLTVAPGAQQSISIVFSPTAAAASSAILNISSNDPAHPSLTVSITGTGVAAAAPPITVTPAAIAFGSVNVGATSNMQVTVANSGATAVTVSLATVAPFSVSRASLTVPANGNAGATISFAPASATPATQTGQLHVTLNGQDVTGSPVSLGGTAVPVVAPTAQLSVSPASIANLTSPGVNQAGSPQPVTITNSGTGAGAASLTTATPFSISTTMTGTFTATASVNVSAQSSITVYVRFLPSSATPTTQTGTLAITSGGQPITGSPVSLSGSISGSGPGTASFTGTWNTDRGGTMVLVQTGVNVNGTYANGGKISGTLSGNTVNGTWSDDTGLGTFSFTLSADGNSFTGNWLQILVPGGGTWNGTRVSSH